jgi:hypothetical protein
MNWNYTNLNRRAAIWTVLIMLIVLLGFQIRDGRWSGASVLLLMDAAILVGLLNRAPTKPN